jgi:transposase-like protein
MIQQYRNGLTVYQLADLFGIARQTVGIILRRHGVNTRPTIPRSDWPELVRLRQAGVTVAGLARRWGVSESQVYKTLAQAGTTAL